MPLAELGIRLKRLPHGEDLPLPAYATAHAAGMDVVAAESVTLAPGTRHAVATGFAIAIPDGYEVQVRPRSGLALKHGVTCLNTPGTIDQDYRGEVKVILANLGDQPFEIARATGLPNSFRPRSNAQRWTKWPIWTKLIEVVAVSAPLADNRRNDVRTLSALSGSRCHGRSDGCAQRLVETARPPADH